MIDSDGIGLIFRAKGDTADARQAFAALEKTINSSTTSAEKDLSGFGRGFNAETIKTAIGSIGGSLKNLGDTIQSVGTQLTVGLTVPLTALATLGIKSALGLDAVRTKITALVGDADKANTKITELRNLANNSVGVTQTAAFETFAQLKGIGGIADETINKLIGSMGKLNAAFKIDDIAGFNQNLNQIFTQGFERSDIKEAIGRVPFFEQLLEQAFGTKDSAKLKQLKDSGKLTLDTFLSGLSGSIDNDPRIANIQENLSIKLAKGAERLNVALAPIGDALLKLVVPALEAAVPYIESMFNWFSKLSPVFQTVIVAVGAFVAALGPALVVIGGVLAAIGSIVSGVVALGGLVVALKLAGIAVLAVAGFLIQFGVVIAATVGLVVLLYKAFQTNFGGIRDYTIAAWETVKAIVSSAMQFIYGVVQTVGGAIVGWWRENYPLIKQTIETVSNSIKSFIQSFLNSVKGFWTEHGSAIMNYVRVYWSAIKDIVSTVFSQIGNFIKFVMNVIRGDWAAAWENVKQSFSNAAKFITQVLSGFLRTLWAALKAIVPIIVEVGAKVVDTVSMYVGKAIAGALYVIATFPAQVLKLLPKLISAGRDIGAAIWKGIREGFQVAAEAAPLNFVGDSNKSDSVSNKTQIIATSQGDSNPLSTSGGGVTGGGNDEAEKRRKEREDIANRDLAAQIQLLQNQLQQAQTEYDKAFAKLKESLEQSGDVEAFQNAFNALKEQYGNEINEIFPALEAAQNKQAANEKKTQNELTLLRNEQTKAQEESVQKTIDFEETAAQTIADVKRNKLKDEIELHEAANRKINAENERSAALGIISDEQVNRNKRLLDIEFLNFKVENLEKQRALFAANSEEEKEITQEIARLKEDISLKESEYQTAAIIDEKKRREEEKKAAQELLEIRKQILQTEREILDFRAAQTKKSLENAVDNSRGKNRIVALIALRDFEISEENRKEQQRLKDLEADKSAALERIKGKENEEAQKSEIENLYKQKALISEQEFQAKLKEIRDGFAPQIEEEQTKEKQGSFLGGIFGFFNGEQLGKFDAGISFMKNALSSLGNVAGQVFGAMANGIGKMVESWVLMGNAGGASLRKFTAQVLASVASQSAVLAVFELAKGFAALFWNPAEAGAHFAAAALFGSIALGSALIGRAIAGNAFKDQTAQATGTSSNSGGGRSSTSGAYSSYGNETQVVESGRNSPSGIGVFRHEITLKVKEKGGWFGQMLEMDVENNGKSRNVILDLVDA